MPDPRWLDMHTTGDNMTEKCEPPPEWRLMAYEHVPPSVVADDLLGVLTDLAHKPVADDTIINTLRRARANVQTFTPPATVAALEAERDDWKRLCTIAEPEISALRQEVQRAGKACFDAQQETVFYRAEVARMKKAASTINEEVCQTLGAALGYPWLKDDQTNFPGATEADGVCVGDHVAESLAAEAAAKLATVAALVEALEGLVMACELPGDHCEREQALPAARAALALFRGEAGR